ncbi:hypothetical protein PMAYCL1PPCAC_32972, partial [Pristionchus mayeri]
QICRVCGDEAKSYNFNVLSCESCKAFFRRNVHKERQLRCPFNRSCEINVEMRRSCKRCRYAKCLDAGMKKDWVGTKDERLVKKARIKESRYVKR